MNVCDPSSFPQQPCTPESDANAPTATNPGAGAAFVELQFYPPGFAPFADSISCDNSHWCSALTIDSLECDTSGNCNNNCVEPVNFAFIQRDGVPTGPPSPQESDLASETPNAHTLLINPGDVVVIHMFNAALPGGGHALEATERDLTTGRSGFMIASKANGFMNTSPVDCSGTPFNPAGVLECRTEQHPSVGTRPLQHQQPVRDRPLRAMQEGHRATAVHGRELQRYLLVELPWSVRDR
jgi:hypothetical protein